MKKWIITLCLGLIFLLSFSFGTLSFAEGKVSSTIFAPKSYLEFYELDAPIDFSFGGGTYVFCESDRIVTFEDELFKEYDLKNYNVSEIAQVEGGKYLLFISNSKLYTLSLEDGAIKDCDIVTNTLSVFGDRLITNPGNSFVVYGISVGEDGVRFDQMVAYSKSVPYRAVAAIDENTWLCVNEGKLYKFIAEGAGNLVPIPGSLDEVRYAVFADGNYYYSSENGVYSISLDGSFTQLIPTTPMGQESLGTTVNPQGLFYSDGLLYICDAGLNAVTCFDTVKKAFTDFAVTTRSDSDNRVSTQASDMKTDGEKVYVIDGNLIKVFTENGHEVSKKVPLSGYYYDFSVIDGNYLLSNGTGLYAFPDTPDGLSQVQITADVQPFKDISAVTSYEKDFYFVNNTMRSSSPYAEVYRTSPDNYGKIDQSFTILGTGLDLTTDLFGRLYMLCYNDKDYIIHSFNHKETSTEIYRTQSKIISITTDFECNVYALTANDQIVKIDGETGAAQIFAVEKSPNIPSNYNAKDIIVVPASDKTYALYDGFILELEPRDLAVATPEHILIPNDLSAAFNPQFKTARIKEGSRIFKIDLLSSLGDEYVFTGYSTYQGKDEFVILYDDGKYSLIVTETLSAIVRSKDLEGFEVEKIDDGKEYYAVSDGYGYGYPVLTPYFRAFEIKENTPVEIAYTFTLDGTAYAMVTVDGNTGFLPRTMVKTNVASDGSPYEMEILQVGYKGATVYLDKSTSKIIGRISPFDSVKVYEKKDGLLKIEYQGGYGYITESQVTTKGSIVIRNFILVSLVVITVMITVWFIYKRFFLNKMETEE